MTLALRPVEQADLELFFRLEHDPVAVWMAAFTSPDLGSRTASDARWQRIMADESVLVRTVLVDGTAVGQVLTYPAGGLLEVSYWIGREHWGHGYATEALRLLLSEVTDRPVGARVAQDNAASLAVLLHHGFTITGQDIGLAPGRGAMVREYVLTLAGP